MRSHFSDSSSSSSDGDDMPVRMPDPPNFLMDIPNSSYVDQTSQDSACSEQMDEGIDNQPTSPLILNSSPISEIFPTSPDGTDSSLKPGQSSRCSSHEREIAKLTDFVDCIKKRSLSSDESNIERGSILEKFF